MRVCGVAFSANDAAMAVLEADAADWRVVEARPGRLSVGDIFDTASVRNFQVLVRAFLAEQAADVVVIKKRATAGKFAGGAASFRMGGVIQVTAEVPVEFLSPQAMARCQREDPADLPGSLRRYQEEAFRAAYTWVCTRL